MDFGLSEEQSLLQDALRGFLADKLPMERVRRVYETDDGRLDGLARELAAQGICSGWRVGSRHARCGGGR